MADRNVKRKPGDWNCHCGEMNFASRTACRKCGSSKGSQQPQPHPRVGDWACAICGHLNFARNQCCRACKTVPSLTLFCLTYVLTVLPVSAKPGDWTCPCGEYNFARNQICRVCRSGKGSAAPTSAVCTVASTAPPSGTPSSASTNVSNDDSNQCVVCMSAAADAAITVCGHLALCMQCAQSLKSCPLCRVPYTPENILKIFVCGI